MVNEETWIYTHFISCSMKTGFVKIRVVKVTKHVTRKEQAAPVDCQISLNTSFHTL